MDMGSEAIWVPLIMAAVSGTATYVNNRNVAHKQDENLADRIRNQNKLQHQADLKTADLINKEAHSTDTQDKAKSMARYNASIAEHMPQATGALKTTGAVSDAYKKDGSNAALGIADYANNLSDLTSSIEAPQLQRMRDQRENINPYGTAIGLIGRENSGDNFLSNLKLNNIKANPWLSLVAGTTGAAAKGMASGGYGAGTDDWLSPYQYGQKKIPGAMNGQIDVSGYT